MEPLTLLFLGGKAIFESVNTAPRTLDVADISAAISEAIDAKLKNVASEIVDAIFDAIILEDVISKAVDIALEDSAFTDINTASEYAVFERIATNAVNMAFDIIFEGLASEIIDAILKADNDSDDSE